MNETYGARSHLVGSVSHFSQCWSLDSRQHLGYANPKDPCQSKGRDKAKSSAGGAPLKNRTRGSPPGRRRQNTHSSAPLARSDQVASSPACNARPSALKPFTLAFREPPDGGEPDHGATDIWAAAVNSTSAGRMRRSRGSSPTKQGSYILLLAVMTDGRTAIDVAYCSN
jgi:hypothetical protein